MNELLKLAIDGHGGARRWEQIERFRAAASISGAIWTLKGQPGLLDGVVLAGETRDQRLIISPFGRPGQYTTWEPYRQTIETTDGVLLAERHDPAAAFTGTTRAAPWDEFQRRSAGVSGGELSHPVAPPRDGSSLSTGSRAEAVCSPAGARQRAFMTMFSRGWDIRAGFPARDPGVADGGHGVRAIRRYPG